jgi:hypothetical protein
VKSGSDSIVMEHYLRALNLRYQDVRPASVARGLSGGNAAYCFEGCQAGSSQSRLRAMPVLGTQYGSALRLSALAQTGFAVGTSHRPRRATGVRLPL